MDQSKGCGLERAESVAVIRGADMAMILFRRKDVIVRTMKKGSNNNFPLRLTSEHLIL